MKEVPFEKAIEKLEEIVAELEAGDLSLENSLKKYEEGVKLARTCQQKLDKAKQRIEQLVKDESGKFKKKTFQEKSKKGDE